MSHTVTADELESLRALRLLEKACKESRERVEANERADYEEYCKGQKVGTASGTPYGIVGGFAVEPIARKAEDERQRAALRANTIGAPACFNGDDDGWEEVDADL